MNPTTSFDEGDVRQAPTVAPPPDASTSTRSSGTLAGREVVDYAARALAQAGLLLEAEASSQWTVDFAAREARYVRIRSEATTVLHLAEIRSP